MNHISIKKLGLAFGLTAALLYVGCAFVMFTVGHDGTVKFFNTLLHGLNVASIIRMNISAVEGLLGILQTFILGWLIGACVAAIYNVSFKNITNHRQTKLTNENTLSYRWLVTQQSNG